MISGIKFKFKLFVWKVFGDILERWFKNVGNTSIFKSFYFLNQFPVSPLEFYSLIWDLKTSFSSFFYTQHPTYCYQITPTRTYWWDIYETFISYQTLNAFSIIACSVLEISYLLATVFQSLTLLLISLIIASAFSFFSLKYSATSNAKS